MKDSSKFLNYAIKATIALILVFFFIKECSKEVKHTEVVDNKIAKCDTFFVYVPVPFVEPSLNKNPKRHSRKSSVDRKDSIVYVDRVVEVQTPSYSDTLILNKYNSKNVEISEMPLDPGYTSIITVDSISRNKIISKKMYIKTYKKRAAEVTNVFIANVEEKKKGGWFVGAGTTINKNVFNSIYGGVLRETKQNEILKLDAGFENNGKGQFFPFVGAGIYFKVK